MGSRIKIGLNSKPYDSGDPCWVWRALCRFPPNLRVRMMKFFLAASTDRLNLKIGFEGCWHGVAIVW